MGELGEIFGILIVIFFGLTASKFILRVIDEKYFQLKKEEPKIYKLFKWLYDFVDKYHGLFGLAALVFIIAHLVVQTIYVRFSYTGLVTAVLMLIQISLGLYGKNAMTSGWYKIHKVLPILIILSFFVHLIF